MKISTCACVHVHACGYVFAVRVCVSVHERTQTSVALCAVEPCAFEVQLRYLQISASVMGFAQHDMAND